MGNEKRIYTVATAHLDTVWRWNLATTIKEYLPDTVEKNLYLMQKLPSYKFNFEGAFRYELIHEYYPELFEKIKEKVKSGQWLPAGSSYENGDVNTPSPEALFRNILLGNNYFEEEFGVRTKDIFLPDCFGFGWALPSVASHANLNGFITQKLSWGSAAGLPFDLGIWRGVDGREIFASLDARSYCHKFENVRLDKVVLPKLEQNEATANLPWTLNLYGVGDIGGAPDESSAAAVERAVQSNSTNSVKVISAKAGEIFDDMAKAQGTTLPVWNDELLMTNHAPGTYTARAMGKRLNRKNETLADYAERSLVAANYLAGLDYPKNVLNTAWKRVIAHQFHDDITGTSIMEVYNAAWGDYFKSLNQFETEYGSAVAAIAPLMNTKCKSGVSLIVNNPVAAARTDCVNAKIKMAQNTPYVAVFDQNGVEVPSQVVSKKGKHFEILFTASVASLSYTVYNVMPSDKKCALKTSLSVSEHTLENSSYRVLLNKNGDIASIVDKKLNKQILAAPIKLAILRNKGALCYPAWEMMYDDLMAPPVAFANTPQFKIIENGPARVTIKVSRTAENSTFVQYISLCEGTEFIRVENEVEWFSRRSLLKVHFPLAAENPRATYDLGLGCISRTNNSEKLFEVPAQKWADLSDISESFGVSIFSDSRQGWDKPNTNTLRLSCVHTPTGAYSKASRQDLMDLGLNRFGFGIFSHGGTFQNGTQLQSEFFSSPLTAFQVQQPANGPLGSAYSFGSISNENVLIRAIKMAEKTDEIIVRVNEGSGEVQSGVTITLGAGIQSAREVFASEEELGKATVKNGKLVFDIDAFSVKTFALKLKNAKTKPVKTVYHPLDLPHNVDVITRNANRQLTIMAASGVSLPAELFPSEINCGGVPFTPADFESRRYNALVPRNQTIYLPENNKVLYIIAATVKNDRQLDFNVDGKAKGFVVHSCFEEIGQWDMYALEQKAKIKNDAVLAYEFSHVHTPQGDAYAQKLSFFCYAINTNDAESITLPDDNSVIILAMTAAENAAHATATSSMIDSVNEQGVIKDTSAEINKILDKMEFTTIRAGKIEKERRESKGKGFKRENIVSNIIRSFKNKD